jgi:hypothetical protein
MTKGENFEEKFGTAVGQAPFFSWQQKGWSPSGGVDEGIFDSEVHYYLIVLNVLGVDNVAVSL